MTANAPGSQGGFSGSANPQGPVAGFDPTIKPKKFFKGKRKPWLDYLKNK